MAETTHTLITNRTTAGVLRDALTAEGHPDIPVGRIFAALQEHLVVLRGRWIAEALEELAGEPHPVSRVAAVLLRERAAEYRSGTR